MKSLILLCFFASPVFAFEFLGSNAQVSTTIDADQGIVCEKTSNACKASGHVHVQKGGSHLYSQSLTAYFSGSSQEKKEIDRFEATGEVHFRDEEGRSARGEYALYDRKAGYLKLTGSNLSLEINDIRVKAQKMITFEDAQKKAMVMGDVEVFQEGNILRTQKLILHFKESSTGQQLEIKQIEAPESLVVFTPTERIEGDRGIYVYGQTESLTVSGNVKVDRADGRLEGEKAEVGLSSGISKVFAGQKRARILIYPGHHQDRFKKVS